MVPIHESDVAENRWKEADWRQFELWERIETRLKRKKTWTVLVVILVFITILSVPIFQDRLPKWKALSAMRALAVKANRMKVDAASLGVPLQLRLEDSEKGPLFVIEKVDSCALGANAQVRSGGQVFSDEEVGKAYRVLGPENATGLGLERVSRSLCYDPAPSGMSDPSTRALGILTAKDLTESRLDRIAFLNFSGLFAEIDFD